MVGFDTGSYKAVGGLPISVTTNGGIPKVRRALTLPCLSHGVRFGVHNQSLVNVLRGLTERVFKVVKNDRLVDPPKPSAGVFKRLGAFRSLLLGKLGSCRPWTMEQFIMSYRGAKQLTVRAAAESLSSRPITKDDAGLKTFVKAEKLNLSSKADPAPRVIQPRDPRYNCVVGPYLKAHEHNVYRAIADVWGGPTVMKGMNAVEQAQAIKDMWEEFPDPCAIGLDASRFDQHVSVDALKFEHSVYNAMFGDSELRQALQWQLQNKGVAYCPDGKVKYSVAGCRMSGDMNTSLGNCLLMCALVYTLCSEIGVRARLANNGDDCVVVVSRSDEKKVRNVVQGWFLEFGFTMKVEDTVYEFEQIEFCQTKPVFANGRYVMCRNPHVCIDKDIFCLHPESNPYHLWAGGVGTAGLALASGVPILQEFYIFLKELGSSSDLKDNSGMSYLASRMQSAESPITPEARVSFYKAFGIPPWEQREAEETLRNTCVDLTSGLKLTSTQFHAHKLPFTDQYNA